MNPVFHKHDTIRNVFYTMVQTYIYASVLRYYRYHCFTATVFAQVINTSVLRWLHTLGICGVLSRHKRACEGDESIVLGRAAS